MTFDTIFLPKWAALFLLLLPGPLCASPTLKLSGTVEASAVLGSVTAWAVSPEGFSAPPTYQWSVTAPDSDRAIVIDFDTLTAFDYMPLNEGAYTVTVVAANGLAEQATASVEFTVASPLGARVNEVIRATGNPLVALYSGTCAAGNVRVVFGPQGTPIQSGMATNWKPCTPGRSVNFLLAGLKLATTYIIQQEVFTGVTRTGPRLSFTTAGSLPPGVSASVTSVKGTTKAAEKIFLHAFIAISPETIGYPEAFDATGELIWYLRDSSLPNGQAVLHAIAGGTFLTIAEPTRLREVDLLGNLIHETNTNVISRQMVSKGWMPIYGFSHDAVRLPNGYTAALCTMQKIFSNGTQGSSAAKAVNILGDGIVVLDKNWQLVWAWNPFDQLDVTQAAAFHETCAQAQPGCGPVTLMPVANDWTHANALWYTSDGNLLISLRNLDMVAKIDYNNGLGAGGVIWRFGKDRDFTIANQGSETYPWFSHQHSVTYTNNLLTVFDNGNSRMAWFGGQAEAPTCDEMEAARCYSRGQAWTLDEHGHIATLVTNASMAGGTAVDSSADLAGAEYSYIIGSSQNLANGNLHFLSGFAYAGAYAESEEFTRAGKWVYTLSVRNPSYRSFRMRDLYTP